MFLRSVGGALLGIPFLPSLAPREAAAQQAGPQAKRFIAIQSYSGQKAREWYPTATPTGYRLRDAIYPGSSKADGTTYLSERVPGTRHSWARLSDFAGTGVSNVLGTSLNAHLDKINLLRGVDYLVAGSHNYGAFLGNYGASPATEVNGVAEIPTIDQVMAYSPRFYPTAPRKRALHLGTGSPGTFSYSNYGMRGGSIEQQSAHLNPAQAWDDVFRGFSAPNMPREHPNRSLLAAVHEDYARVSRSPRLSNADRQSLDRHVSFLADIERGLMNQQRAACSVPPRPRNLENGYPWRDVSSIGDLSDTVSLMIDVAVAAIKCDLTRVVTFNIQKALFDLSGSIAASFHESGNVAGDWHQFAHDSNSSPAAHRSFVAISQWIARAVFGAFVERLDVEEADGKTFLDNSLVVWGNELGYDHYSTDVQTIMAGSAGGALRTGYYVDYIDWTQSYANPIQGWGVLSPGVPHNRWLVTMLQAMGLQPGDYEQNGQPGYGHGEIVSPPWNWPGYTSMQLGTPLPGITV